MGAALPIAAIAMSAIAPIVQGIGANEEARAQARASDENARLSIMSGENDVAGIMRQERMQVGDAIAANAGSGFVPTGSFSDIIAESARQRDRDIAIRRQQAEGQARNYRQQASDARAAGRNAIITGVFGGVANALSGANSMRNANRASAARDQQRETYLGSSGG